MKVGNNCKSGHVEKKNKTKNKGTQKSVNVKIITLTKIIILRFLITERTIMRTTKIK